MKTNYLILAAAVLALAACNKQEAPAPAELSAPAAISFDGYLNRGVATRSGIPGDITTNILQTSPNAFGVFAYYTGNNSYDDQSMPNFMYNQKVTYDGNAWTYSPLKYWPNEYGSSAISDDVDKVSFFAYAPYVSVTPATGKVEDQTFGITGMIRNSASGDPVLKYIASFDPAKSVDLCWGVAGNDADVTWNIFQKAGITGNSQTFVKGLPWMNVERPLDPTAGQKLKFTFDHALSKLNVQIDAYFDEAYSTSLANSIDAKTKIYVRSITFTGFAMKGALNLNNTKAHEAAWLDYAGTTDLVTGDELTVFDGRKDGKEGVEGATASNEKTLGLNPVIISDNGNTQVGVTSDAVNLFGKTGSTAITDDESIFVIPTGDAISVTIVYDVETEDDNLPTLLSDGKTYGSSVNNVIRKENIQFAGVSKFENGKAYTLKLHLGMNSVKFDAAVSEWGTATETNVHLPNNSQE